MQGPVAGSRAPQARWSWVHAEAPEQLFLADPRARVFLLSFAMLFFELLCIRWIPSYIRYLAYFTNFILLASFLGIGLGMLAARRERFWFPPFPVLVLTLTLVVAANRFELRVTSTDVLYYGAGEGEGARAEHFVVLPIVFGLVAASFIPLARPLGLLFARLRPLTAYTCDILGSLAGIAAFFAVSTFALPPTAWFALLALPLLLLSTRRALVPVAACLLVSLAVAGQLQRGAYWSPYYKIGLHPAEPRGYIVDVNNAGGHQAMIPWQDKEPFYRRLYELFPGPSFRRALILGAGSGSDVSTALAAGVPSVTAVEIDPTIQRLGAAFHPDRPYQDPRVGVVIDDGRTYLRHTEQRYDLIIFALPDSLTLTSSNTSLRLESFLLTQEALAAARDRLTDDGLLVLYNYYREDWLVEKLAGMAARTFGRAPLVSTYGGWGRAAVIMAGPRLATLPPGAFGPYRETAPTGADLRVIGEGYYPVADREPATDDWPFLYLRQRGFPALYLAGLAMVGLFTAGGLAAVAPRRVLRRFDWHMFALGVAFMLLEVKSLVTFALLFGSTWRVNSLVFFAILSSVLLAILVNARCRIRRVGLVYALLCGLLLVNLLLPPQTLLLGNPALRYLVASALAFAPVFLANVLFAQAFRDSAAADIAFASNLLGAMVGGMLEYCSMLVGYHRLLLLVLACYACAMLLRDRHAAARPRLVEAVRRRAGAGGRRARGPIAPRRYVPLLLTCALVLGSALLAPRTAWGAPGDLAARPRLPPQVQDLAGAVAAGRAGYGYALALSDEELTEVARYYLTGPDGPFGRVRVGVADDRVVVDGAVPEPGLLVPVRLVLAVGAEDGRLVARVERVEARLPAFARAAIARRLEARLVGALADLPVTVEAVELRPGELRAHGQVRERGAGAHGHHGATGSATPSGPNRHGYAT
jgi:hypothetical protein